MHRESEVPLLAEEADPDFDLDALYPPRKDDHVHYIRAKNLRATPASRMLLFLAIGIGMLALFLTVFFAIPMLREWIRPEGTPAPLTSNMRCAVCVSGAVPSGEDYIAALKEKLQSHDTFMKCADDCKEIIEEVQHEDDSDGDIGSDKSEDYEEGLHYDEDGEVDFSDWPSSDNYSDYEYDEPGENSEAADSDSYSVEDDNSEDEEESKASSKESHTSTADSKDKKEEDKDDNDHGNGSSEDDLDQKQDIDSSYEYVDDEYDDDDEDLKDWMNAPSP